MQTHRSFQHSMTVIVKAAYHHNLHAIVQDNSHPAVCTIVTGETKTAATVLRLQVAHTATLPRVVSTRCADMLTMSACSGLGHSSAVGPAVYGGHCTQ